MRSTANYRRYKALVSLDVCATPPHFVIGNGVRFIWILKEFKSSSWNVPKIGDVVINVKLFEYLPNNNVLVADCHLGERS